MARAPARTRALRLVEPPNPFPEELKDPITYDLSNENEIGPGVTFENGVLHIDHGDGSATIDFEATGTKPQDPNEGFHANLANKIEQSKLDEIASALLDGIQRDIDSRKEWLETRARGIQLLGLKLEEPRSDVGTSSAPLEGMSTVRHPLLLGATINFQATARGELLPAGGPAKVRNDTPPRPPKPQQPQQPQQSQGQASPAPAAPGGMPPSPQALPGVPPAPGINPAQMAAPFATEYAVPPIERSDSLADALETDFNHYLTAVATEYIPDTDRMLFYVGFGGDGFKKVYNCPLRRRPVSESVDAENLIVSNSATDLKNASRVTHCIKMRKSILRRMQILGAYRDVQLNPPNQPKTDPVKEQKQEIFGQNEDVKKPEDLDYTIYECYCELEFDEYAPAALKGKALPLPYIVTLEETSRQVLAITRNWKEDDELCIARNFFVQYPFVRGLGFYGLGFIHILGNTTSTLTAVWREVVDSGMFSNFPGFIYNTALGRQLTNQFRVPPGGGIGVQAPMNSRVSDHIMPLPYKDVSGAFINFAQWVEQDGMKLAQTADIAIGEGKQEAPVGTTLALIEQATKIMDSVHKRLHASQSEEFALLKERFKEDPEAFWRHNKKPAMAWERKQFLEALDNYNLVPVADPNNPTSLHRAAKAAAIEGLAAKYPQLINQQAALERVFRVAGIDSEGLFHAQPLPPPPDPRMVAIQQKAQATQASTQAQAQAALAKVKVDIARLAEQAKDRESRERLEAMKLQLEQIKLQQAEVIHQHEIVGDHVSRMAEIEADRQKTQQELMADQARTHQELQADQIRTAHEMQADALTRHQDLQIGAREHHHELEKERAKHQLAMQQAHEKHTQTMEHQRQLHEAKLAEARALAAVAKRNKTTKKESQ